MNQTLKYSILIFLLGSFFLVELVVGLIANSLTLQTDAFHMLSDLLAASIALISYRLTFRDKTYKYTYGWARAEIIGGLINSVFLISTCFFLGLEVIHKIVELVNEDGKNDKLETEIDTVLIVGGVGLFINIIGLFLFHDHTHNHGNDIELGDVIEEDINNEVVNHNQAALFLHIFGDFLGSVIVILTSLLIKYTDWEYRFYIDPLASLLVIIVIVVSSLKLFKYTINILLHRTPRQIDIDLLLSEIKSLDQITGIHDFHLWSLTNKVVIASFHIELASDGVEDTDELLLDIKKILHRYEIHSSSIQIENSQKCLDPICRERCSQHQCC